MTEPPMTRARVSIFTRRLAAASLPAPVQPEDIPREHVLTAHTRYIVALASGVDAEQAMGLAADLLAELWTPAPAPVGQNPREGV